MNFDEIEYFKNDPPEKITFQQKACISKYFDQISKSISELKKPRMFKRRGLRQGGLLGLLPL
jgi:hypothetical protein